MAKKKLLRLISFSGCCREGIPIEIEALFVPLSDCHIHFTRKHVNLFGHEIYWEYESYQILHSRI